MNFRTDVVHGELFRNFVLEAVFHSLGFCFGCYRIISALMLYIGMPQSAILFIEMPSVFIRVERHNM